MCNAFKASNFVRTSFGNCDALLRWANNIQGCLNRNDFDHQSYENANAHPYPSGDFPSNDHDSSYDADPHDQPLEHPCVALKKILSSGTFYYSVDFDLTNRLQSRYNISQPVGAVCAKARTEYSKIQLLTLTVSRMTFFGTLI